MHCFWSSVSINTISMTEAATRGVLYRKVFLKLLQNSHESACVSESTCNFIIKETLAQLFSYEFCKILKNVFFTKHLLATACAIVFSSMSVFLSCEHFSHTRKCYLIYRIYRNISIC